MYYFSALLVTLGLCGLRDYGTGEWTGGDEACDHQRAMNRQDAGRAQVDGFHGSTLGGAGAAYYGSACGRCGARRVDSQLGLEPSPSEYVERMVAVFREVWRVLRDDGTVWLNLGDSYAGAGYSNHENTGGAQREDGGKPRHLFGSGLKSKDLVGIPWRVAFALQQPWYSGTIKREIDRVWLAAMIDAEGCMFIHKRPVGAYASTYTRKDGTQAEYRRKTAQFGAGLEVSSTDRVIVERCMEIAGIGSICEQTPEQNARRKQTIYRWNVRSNECRDIIREVYPHLVAKKHEARLVCGCPSSGVQAEAAHEGLKAIHQGGSARIDFPEPESMFERGWCLRSDLIWAKLCPTPCPNLSRIGVPRATSICLC